MIDTSLALAKDLSHPFSQALAHSFAGWFHALRREPQATREQAQAAIELSTKHRFAEIVAFGTLLRGHALFQQGEAEEGIAQMRQGLGAWRTTGAEVATPFWLALLAEALGKAGQVGEGLKELDEVLNAVQRSGERFYEAELNRLKGDLLLRQSCPAGQEAEVCFLRAIDIARRQSTKLLELRAVVSLSRLLQKQNRKEEARERLSEIYGWFTEGFGTVDLADAKELLKELSG